MQLSLLQLLLSDAIEQGQLAVALGLAERLIDADPYAEEHYLLAAELHLKAGSRRSAVSVVTRAQRMLDELGLAPSGALCEAAAALDRV